MASQTCPTSSEPTFSFTQGLIFGQLSVVVILAAFIKFFIFGDPPSADVTASVRASERRARTLAHKQSLLSLGRKKSSVLRSAPPLSIGSILSKAYYNVDSHQPESLDWFNVLVAQTIAQFRSDAQHDDAILDSLTKALNGPSRPDFVDNIRVTELSLGDDFPIFSNCRIIPVDDDGIALGINGFRLDAAAAAAARDGARLQARMDVDLSDMLTMALETKLLLNYPKKLSAVLPVALSVSVIRFSGTLSISFIPSNPSQSRPTMMTFSFLDDYRLDFSIRSLLGSRSRLQDVPKIAQLVEARLHRWFDERAVEPRFQEIALPSLWPRKRNTRGPDDAMAVPDIPSSIGRSRGKDLGREVRDEARRKDDGGEDDRRDISSTSSSLRQRRTAGGGSNVGNIYNTAGSLPSLNTGARP
ncbi:hypothetical protein CDD81_2775 [Ophiocordyceps australis]|uniref:Maintenance of mitochondrial morphology protein 1 n=1 Tax=Ophiocordyceps australis TaxID=1399860 RepID=A0A2C5XXG4_9HYPO|nr:hypothetical protein CDD81_2775 [Ophiocordyceps australis]